MRSTSKISSTCFFVFTILVACFFVHPLVEADSRVREDLSNRGGPESRAAAGLQLSLVWFDAYRLLPHSLEAMSREVNRIFGEIGVDVRWEMGGEVHDDEDTYDEPLRLYVVLLPSEPSSWGLGEHVMGAATHGEGKKGGVYLFYPQIVKTLSFEGVEMLGGRKYLARAIGRIVVHELVHVLAPDHPHTGSGLMGWHLTRHFLMRSEVHLDEVSSSVVIGEIQALGNLILLAGDFGEEFAGERAKGATRPVFVPERPR